MFFSLMSTDNLCKFAKIWRFSSGLSTKGAIVISPQTLICSKFAIFSINGRTSSVLSPNLLSSWATFTSIKILAVRLCFAASFSIVSASLTESTEWIRSTLSIIYFTLLVCRCPIMCQWISSGSASYLAVISCTLFSPISYLSFFKFDYPLLNFVSNFQRTTKSNHWNTTSSEETPAPFCTIWS